MTAHQTVSKRRHLVCEAGRQQRERQPEQLGHADSHWHPAVRRTDACIEGRGALLISGSWMVWWAAGDSVGLGLSLTCASKAT